MFTAIATSDYGLIKEKKEEEKFNQKKYEIKANNKVLAF